MEITGVSTLRYEQESALMNTEHDINITTLLIHTDTGITGLGETFPLGEAESSIIHDTIAENLVGKDPRDIAGIHDSFATYFNYYGNGGAERRALSAVDIACWDIKGKAAGVPIYELLGGKAREAIPAYNTCYDLQYDFMEEPASLAESLLDQGITSMKIWPFDELADETNGQRITSHQLEEGLAPLRAIREAVGTDMEVAIEGHGQWALTPAKRIVRALSDYDPIWAEDFIRKGNLESYQQLARASSVPLCVSERLISRYEFEMAMETGAVDIVMPDLCWVGGFTEARAIADMAAAHQLPVAPHNPGGPVLHLASAHLSATIPNLYVMESIRDRYDGWYENLVTDPLPAHDGAIPIPDGPGLGTEFRAELIDHPDTIVRETRRS